MKIAYVTTTFRRLAHTMRTVPENVRLHQPPPGVDAVFHVLDYGSPEGEAAQLLAAMASFVRAGRLVVWRATDQPCYRPSHSKNLGALLAIREGADVVVTVDADTFVQADYSRHLDLPPRTYALVGTFKMNIGGRVAVRADDFLRVRGYDEAIGGYAWQDLDLYARLSTAGCRQRELPTSPFLTHDDRLRTGSLSKEHQDFMRSWDASEAVAKTPARVVNPTGYGEGAAERNGGDWWIA